MGKSFGYARVSTTDQSPEKQINALTEAGAVEIFTDHALGSRSDRPALDDLMAAIATGDTVVVWKLDRLGRSTSHLVSLIDQMGAKSVNFKSLTDPIGTTTPWQANLPRDRLHRRVKTGSHVGAHPHRSCNRTRRPGRRPSIKPRVTRHIDRLVVEGMSQASIADAVGVSRFAVGRYLGGQMLTYQPQGTPDKQGRASVIEQEDDS